MALIKSDLANFADLIDEAERKTTPIAALSKQVPDITKEEAREIQELNVGRKMRLGHRVVGYKIGLTNREAQKHFNVFEPDMGHLFDSMSGMHQGEIDLTQLIQPKIEGEIAFVLGRDLRGPGITIADALDAVDSVFVALEIIDCRYDSWRITHPDLIADNGASGRFVLAPIRKRLRNLDLGSVGMALSQNGEVMTTGAGSAVMGNPVEALVFLANELGKRSRHLHAGEIILSGAVTGMLSVSPGDSFTCEAANLGQVSIRFTGERSAR
jgi:2-keto-4-pentenoate hydratase